LKGDKEMAKKIATTIFMAMILTLWIISALPIQTVSALGDA